MTIMTTMDSRTDSYNMTLNEFLYSRVLVATVEYVPGPVADNGYYFRDTKYNIDISGTKYANCARVSEENYYRGCRLLRCCWI